MGQRKYNVIFFLQTLFLRHIVVFSVKLHSMFLIEFITKSKYVESLLCKYANKILSIMLLIHVNYISVKHMADHTIWYQLKIQFTSIKVIFVLAWLIENTFNSSYSSIASSI